MSNAEPPIEEKPSFDFDFNATAEQQAALRAFLDFASSTPAEKVNARIVRGMELYDRNPDLVNQTAAYLEANPEGFAVISIWRQIDQTRADRASSFDVKTEEAIDVDPENKRILQRFQKAGSESDRLALRRNRFRILGKRAAAAAQKAADNAA